MALDIALLHTVVAVAKAGGFREAARMTGSNPSRISDAVRRAEEQLGVRLFNRTTRTVALTEAGRALMSRLLPAMDEVDAALDALNNFRDTPGGTLRLNVPVSAARIVLPAIVPGFLQRFPDIQLEVVAESNVQDVFRDSCDAGIRYDDHLEQDMVALPIGPRRQRFALAAAPAYLAQFGTPQHPRDLLQHRCLHGRYATGVIAEWEFTRGEETVSLQPKGPLLCSIGATMELTVEAAIAGCGVVYLFEDWIKPALSNGNLQPILPEWWQSFSGLWLYYNTRRLIPTPLQVFLGYVRELNVQYCAP